MGRPRLPVDAAVIKGADQINPGRFKGRRKPGATKPLGAPYERMSEAEKVVWHEFKEEIPWLNSSHRRIVRLGCQYVVAMETAKRFQPGVASGLRSLLGMLGATPVDETKIDDLSRFGHVGDTEPGEPEEPEGRFFDKARPN